MRRVVVAIATALDSSLVRVIEAVDDRIEVRYQPDLIPRQRFPGDHTGVDNFQRGTAQEARWRQMLAGAEVIYGVPGDSAHGLADLIEVAPAVRWVQTTRESADHQVRAAGLTRAQRQQVTITSARGIHVTPLAEFAVFGVLASAKRLPQLLAEKEPQPGSVLPAAELADQTLLMIGLGPVGIEVARLATAFGMEVLAINRTGRARVPHVEIVRPARFLADLLPSSHAVVISLPLTAETRNLVSAPEIAGMRRDAVVIDIGAAGVVDQQALIDGLRSGQPAAAVLNVDQSAPLAPDSPLWTMPNVLINPYTAALSAREDRRLVEFFSQNLDRYLHGEELVNQI